MTRNRYIKAAFIILAMSLSILLSSHAYSAAYYIDYASGSDSNKGTSASAPWKRSPGMKGFAANYTHVAGDRFLFKGGVTWPASALPFKIVNSGAGGNPDIYMGGQRCGQKGSVACNGGVAWGAGYPVFDGEDKGIFQSGLITKAGTKNHVTIDGLKVIRTGNLTNGSGMAVAFGGGSYITVKNCWLQPNSVNAFAYGTSSGTHTAIYFHDNIIKQAGRVHVLVAGDARTTDVKFYNNTMYGGYDYDPVAYHSDGFMIGGSGIDDYAIQGLYIYNNKFTGSWARYATAQLYLNGMTYYCYDYTNGSHQPTIGQVLAGEKSAAKAKVWYFTNTGGWAGEGNGKICVSSPKLLNGENIRELASYGGSLIGKVASSATYTGKKSTKDVYIYNNLFVTEHNTGKTFSPGVIDISAGHDNIKIYNNTIDTRSNSDMQPAHCIFLSSFVTNIDIKNNILSGCTNGITFGDTVDKVNLDYNLYNPVSGQYLILDGRTGIKKRCNTLAACQAQPISQEAHGKTGDPKFVTLPRNGIIGSGDWHLKSDSPARTGGVNMGPPYTTDMDGIIGTGRIGAYESR